MASRHHRSPLETHLLDADKLCMAAANQQKLAITETTMIKIHFRLQRRMEGVCRCGGCGWGRACLRCCMLAVVEKHWSRSRVKSHATAPKIK
eukprot:scaffold4621_cov194-Alexandrium_tamarense.AAC.9